MTKAIALFSGGLDSTLAVLTVLKQGIGVKAIKFRTPFDCATTGKVSALKNRIIPLQGRGFELEYYDLGEEFLPIVKNPKHGHGKNMNPCIDCRILMLKKAKEFMNNNEADFILTGEVLGQRPMSQRKDMLYHIDKEAGVTDYVLRPLSAKFLRVTVPEAKGSISRNSLYGFSGRSRKPQMALALDFGLTEYPSPAGGCLLTEPTYAHRLKDLLTFDSAPSMRDIDLLRIGRHFRFSPLCKIIIGRDGSENDMIESLASDKDCILRVEGYGSPLTLVTGKINDEAIKLAASLCARYSDAKHTFEVETIAMQGGAALKLKVLPADNEMIGALRIERRKAEKIPTT
jgi:tRNA-uridine 2-sulfurtransferase